MDYVIGVDVHSVNNPGDRTTNPVVIAANWKAVYDEGVRFVFMKATENNFEDRVYDREKKVYINRFAERWQYAKDAGLLRGAYHFLHPEQNNIAEQAETFIRTVGSDQGELPPVLDLETAANRWPPPDLLLARIKDWLDRVEAAFGRKPIIYTSDRIIKENGIANPPWGMDYPTWLAQYPWMSMTQEQYRDPHHPPGWSATYPSQPSGYQAWKFWQFTEKGRVNGFGEEHVDIDLFRGSYAELLQFAGLESAPIPEPQVEPVTQPYMVLTGDSLPSIAEKLGVDLLELLRLNNDVLLKAGMQLRVPSAAPEEPEPGPVEEPPASATFDYVVKASDTLSGLALRYRTSIAVLLALNPQITNPNIIVTGSMLKIPRV